jgi:WD40 repeat protein
MKIQPFDYSFHRRPSGDRDRLLPPDRKSPAKIEENSPLNDQTPSPRFAPSPRFHRARPSVISKVLDAPDVLTEFPAKLIDFSARNQLAVALGASIYIWEDERVAQLMEADANVTGVCWAEDRLVVSARGEVELWDVGRSCIVRPLPAHAERCCSLSFAGHRAATGGADSMVRVTDLRNSSGSAFAGHHGEITALAWSLDGVHLASGSSDSKVIVWGDRKRRAHELTTPIRSLTYVTPTVLAVAELDESGAVRFLCGQESHVSVATGAPISGLAFSEHWGIFMGHRQGSFQWELWSPEMRRLGEYAGHTGDILEVCVSQDGSMLATLGADETLQIWQLRDGKARTPSFDRKPRSPILLR